jgi:hypothetical protein
MVELSKTVVICTFLFFFNKFVVKIPWKRRLTIGKSSALPQQNCIFVSRELRGKVPFFARERPAA